VHGWGDYAAGGGGGGGAAAELTLLGALLLERGVQGGALLLVEQGLGVEALHGAADGLAHGGGSGARGAPAGGGAGRGVRAPGARRLGGAAQRLGVRHPTRWRRAGGRHAAVGGSPGAPPCQHLEPAWGHARPLTCCCYAHWKPPRSRNRERGGCGDSGARVLGECRAESLGERRSRRGREPSGAGCTARSWVDTWRWLLKAITRRGACIACRALRAASAAQSRPPGTRTRKPRLRPRNHLLFNPIRL
jgi:hypothetical protein